MVRMPNTYSSWGGCGDFSQQGALIMRTFRTYLLASVALATFGVAEQADAQTFINGGGATLPSKVYRQLFDCYAFPVDGNTVVIPGVPGSGSGVVDAGQADAGRKIPALAIAAACPNPAGNLTAGLTQFLYSPVGSGGGKRAFRTFNAGSGSAGLGVPSASNSIPYVSAFSQNYGYPHLHFAGSDDIVLASDLAAYSSTGSATNPVNTLTGRWLQIPALAAGVTVSHSQNDGNHSPLNLAPGVSLKLSRKAVCGIMSGHVTQWDNSIITADNGVTVGHGPITFVHRSDGSGTNFLFTNAMAAQCVGIFGPNNETPGAPLALYSFPWTDLTLAATQCPAIPAQGSNQTNWPDVSPDQCGTAVSNPGGGHFNNGNGNAGVVAQIHAIDGAIGYVTPDFVDPVVPIGTGPGDGLPTAAVQNQYDIDNGLTAFEKPTFQNVAIAMSAQVPVFDDTSRANPLNWSRQMVNPNPTLPGAYPIAGYTQLNLYQCYADANVYNGLLSYLGFHYTQDISKNILHAQQFTEVPGPWFDEILKLLSPDNATTGFNLGGVGACSGHAGQPA